MKRPKFRAWYKPDLEVEPFKFEMKRKNNIPFFEYATAGVPFTYRFEEVFTDENWILDSYTGHKDKNGVEIYEGDIVEVKEIDCEANTEEWFTVGIVEWLPHEPRWFVKGVDTYLGFQNWEDCEFTVLGNIYENKDLLLSDKHYRGE